MKTFKPDTCDTLHTVEIGMAGSAPAFFTEKTTVFSHFLDIKFLLLCLTLFVTQLTYAQYQYEECEAYNSDEIGVDFPIHPSIRPDLDDSPLGVNDTWSTFTPYGGCPSTCDPGSPFDCCITQPCEPYQIPVVFTLLADNACGNIDINTADLDDFLIKINNYYACAGVPFEFSKCTSWDDAGQMQLTDSSTRMICDDDLNLFYRSPSNDTLPTGDMIDDYIEARSFNIPSVMNIYVPGDYNGFTSLGFTSEGGVANFPSGNLSSYGMAFGINALKNTNEDCNTAVIGTASTAIHEIGHWFGLYHTHGPVNNVQVASGELNSHVECPDGSQCCTLGDFICDTDPDPNLSVSGSVQNTGGNTVTSCVIGGGCDKDASGCFSVACDDGTTPAYPANINAEVNIMSYAGGNCRYEFTPCQIAKMIDGMLCARSDLSCCDPNFADTNDPAPYISTATYTICLGDAVPTFTIDTPAGLNNTCLGWYATDSTTTDFNALGTGLSFTPPTTGPNAIDVNTVGTYTYYFDDDLNNFSTVECDDDVRKAVEVIVEDCSPECPAVVDESSNASICSGALGTEITAWQTSVEATNAAAIADANTDATVTYSPLPTNSNSTCSNVDETVTATLNCFGPDGIAGNGDDILLTLGTFTLTTFPAAQDLADGIVGCVNTPTPFCGDDTFGTTATIPTGGADVANWDGTTYTAQPGDAAGTIDVMVTTDNGCTATYTIATPACPSCDDPALTGATICAAILANPASPLATLDCDGGGVDNATECDNGGDPLDPCDDPGLAGTDICTELLANPASPLATLDCDGGGVDNATECDNGSDPLNPDDDECDLTLICPPDTTISCTENISMLTDSMLYVLIGGNPNGCDSLTITANGFIDPGPCGGDVDVMFSVTIGTTTIDCPSTITVAPTPPTITCPIPDVVEVACLADVVADTLGVTASGGCGAAVIIEIGDPIPDIFNSTCGQRAGDAYRIQYTAIDNCGGRDSCTQTFVIENNPTPIALSCPADIVLISCRDEVIIDTALIGFTTSCGLDAQIEAILTPGSANSDCGELPDDEYVVEYIITDDCNRVARCFQTFIITNPEPVIITCPADTTVTCLSDVTANLAALEYTSCRDSLVIASDTIPLAGNSPCGQLDGDQYTITYTVVDSCGLDTFCIQTFTIDSDEPTITCPADTTVACFTDIVTDAADAIVTTTCDLGSTAVTIDGPTVGVEDCPGTTYTYRYSVEDDCGRIAFCDQVFTIANDPPMIDCPADEVVACEADIEEGTPIVTTSCGLESGISTSGPTLISGTADCPDAEYEIIYTVRDSCGRTANCAQIFTIANDEPTITCPADTVVACFTDIAAGMAITTTSCGLESGVSTSDPTLISGTVDCPSAEYEIVYTVTDSCGRVADCAQRFRIANDGPTIACPMDTTVTCFTDIVASTPTVATSCGLESGVSTSEPTLISGTADCPDAEYEIVYTVMDSCGRTADCAQRFTIANAEPTITCPTGGNVTCFADIIVGDATFTTSCGVGGDIVVTGPEISGTPDCNTTQYTYTHTGTDACGRVASCQQVFAIINDPPTITCPEDCPVACESDIRPGTPEFTTSCGLIGTVTVSDPLIVGDPGCDGTTYTYTYTVSDGCDRTASCGQTFTIVNDCHRIDFDYDDEGNPLPPGTDMFDQYDDFTITTEGHLCAQLFDTGNPTSNDFDLGTPNEQYGGPGVGTGGDNNTEFQGNALIASYDCGTPNEKEGKLIFDFDCSVTIKTVDLLDMKCAESEVELYDEHGNRIGYLDIPAYGVNSFNVFDVHVSGVYQMIIDLDCGGGVTGFKYCKDNTPGATCGTGPTCEDYHLDFSDNGNHWAMNDMSGSFDVDGQTYDISIADADGILVDTEENESGLQVGIDPHNVNDEVIICYNLSQISDNIVFDITDLDKKDGNSKQQEAVCVYGLLGDDPTRIMPLITDLDGSVDIDGNCAEATTNSAYGRDESVLVEFSECIDKVVIVYGTGSDSPTANPSYSSITIGASVGFNSEVCPGDCLPSCDGVSGTGSDDDGDGVCNDLDVCEGGDDNQDRDGDGIPDACDDICYDYNIDHGDCGAGWGHDDTSGSIELGLETVDITIIDNDNIFVDSEAVGSGLQVGIDPHNVDDELVLCYNLSNSSSNVVFDIVDLDLKDSNSKQQEKVCVYGTLGADSTPIMPTVTSLDGHVAITDNCGEGTTNSAHSGQDESVLVEFTECIDKITIVYGTGSQSPTNDPTYSKIVIGGSVFTIEQCKGGCDEPCAAGLGSGDGDSDGDGVCDGDDICEGGDDNQDTDGDGTPDFCDDDCTVGGSSARGDDDGDFVCNDEDQCEGFDDNIDTNNNGVPDGCEENCDDYMLDFEEDGYTWTGHNLMESYTVGSQTFDINIIDGDNILDRTYENGSGISIGTNPHNIDDNVVICYNLSEVSNNVVFDIVDLDYKDGSSRQQEAVCVYGTLGADPTRILPMIISLEGAVSITDNCAEATANSAVSGQDESILVEFTECIDKVTIVYGTGSSSPTANPDYGKITIGQDYGFSTEVCTNACVAGSPREEESNANITLYPNPVYGSNSVTVEIDTEARGDAQLVLVDALGRTISTEGIQLVNNITNHQISTEQLPSGIYFVQLHTAAWRTNGMKLVVVKP